MAVLQTKIPYDVSPKRLPGIAPLVPADGWIIRDEAFAGQMALRDQLIGDQRSAVWSDTGADPAAKAEVLQMVLATVADRAGYHVSDHEVTRPDGVVVALQGDPLITAARLIQEDLLIHEKHGDEHVLTAAVLCFPASWTLAEKIGKPLSRIHWRVDDYDPNIAKRVQRLFDGIQPGRPLWRFNRLRYPKPDLFLPRSEHAPRSSDEDFETGPYVRSEHQALVRLPKSRAVVFAIHTFVVATPE